MQQMKADPHYLFDVFVRLYRMVFLMEVTPKGYRYVRVSEQGKRASSLPDDVSGRYLHEMYAPDVANELILHYDVVVSSREPVYFMSKMNIEANTARFASSMLMPLEDDTGEVRYVLGLTTDLSEDAEMKLLSSIENIDYLTGMPNLMKVKLELEKLFAKREREEATSVMRFHINRFKIILSLQGVERSQRLIKEMTRHLSDLLPKGSIIGRVDGEDFIAVLPHTSIETAYMHGERLLATIADYTYHVAETEFTLSGCLGISSGSEDADQVIMNASTALLEARQAGKQMIKVYEKDDYMQHYIDEMTIEMELHKGLKAGELGVVYQPKVDCRNGTVHFEALVRWKNTVLGNISPETFIKIAEKSLLIEDITEFVFERVCRDLSDRSELFNGRRVAVNLSPVLFRQDYVRSNLIPLLTAYGLSADQFEFEITEHTLMQEPLIGIHTVDYLKAMGFHILIDDFGVSYSSLNYLKMFDIDGIKIDRSFISQLDKDNGLKEYEIVKLIVALAKKLNLAVTAEGVETEAQYRAIQRLGCDDVQGYFFSRPLSLSNLEPALETIVCQYEALRLDGSDRSKLEVRFDETEAERLKTILRLEILDTPREERYDRISRLVAKTLEMPIALISILTTDRQWIKSCQGTNFESPPHIDRKWTLCDRVVTGRGPLVIEDVKTAEALSENPLLEGIGFYAGVPLMTRSGHVIGTLCVTDGVPRSFEHEAVQTLEDFARWVMAEIELTEQARAQERRQQTLESLYEVTAIQAPFADKLKRIQEVLREWIGYSHAVIFSTESRQRVLSADGDAWIDWTDERLQHVHALTTVGHQKLKRSELVLEGVEFASMISLPLSNEGKTFGWVVFLAEQGSLNDVADAVAIHEMTDTILLVTRWMENEIRRERKHQEVIELITKDGLTKLPNRHSLMTDLRQTMNRKRPVALLFIDLDDFKRINDTHGHLVGDEVLVEVAKRIGSFSHMHAGKAYRFAGDEFLIVIETGPESLEEAVFDQLSTVISREIMVGDGLALHLSASIGVAYSDASLSSLDTLIHHSDAAMYIAKNGGGDGYYIYDSYQENK
ncbi:EAL domain-containing protein [Exiguobacterium sp. SH3S2]|uniref:EAL domain-containing protein n=1 Tax=unclassified Exiguobacterium TaxID=2644629 RepID=UPI00103E9013|nr:MULTISPECIES: EAL domain-containing protein [unclassified Exiguobacterium]TCI47368.1 EAL domain-containing protein [Exiguobacterium sp. SH3S3]TCI62515.1 EAL domain-containing protein [Exiguobacterium sp. SH3S2]